MDGRLLAMQDVDSYPAAKGEVALARNRIGSPLCEPELPWAIRNVIPGVPLMLPGGTGATAKPWTPPADRGAVQREAPVDTGSAPPVDAAAAHSRRVLAVFAWAWVALMVWILGRLAGIRWAALIAWILLTAARPFRAPAAWIWRQRTWVALACLAAAGAAFAWHRRVAYLNSVGPVRIRLLLPDGLWTREQPILSTGKSGAGTLVYVRYSDKGHIQLNADIWGALYQSDLIAVNYAEPQDIVINSSGLYPLDHPRVKTFEPDPLQLLRNDFFISLGGRTVLSGPHFAYDSKVSEVAVGENRIHSSFGQPTFTGRLLSVERLSFVRELRVADGEAVRLRFRLRPAEVQTDQPLLSLGRNGNLGACVARILPNSTLEVRYRSADGAVTESARLRGAADARREVEIVPGFTDNGRPLAGALISIDGLLLASPKGFRAYGSCPAFVGLDPAASAGAGQFFGSPELSASLVTLHEPAAPRASAGAVSLLVRFPADGTGSDPLVVSGVTGAGDFLYVSYLGGGRLKFGFDHWGSGGAVGEPFPFDPSNLHRLEIETASLRPLAGHAATGPVRVKLDGVVVLEGVSPVHPHTQDQIFLGSNPIGGSTCGTSFHGEILDSRPE
jgi:hypothetical protein